MTSVYHYTSADGVIGILDRKCFRFSDVRFLNDPSELQRPIDFALRTATKLGRAEPDSESQRAFLFGEIGAELSNVKDALDRSGVFVFSLSNDPDSLSLWERYAAQSGGYALELDIEQLKKALEEVNKVEVRYLACQYGDAALQGHVDRCMTRMLDDFDKDPAGQPLSLRASGFWYDVLWSPDFFSKHDAFRSEGETRLVVINSDPFPRQFRAKGSFIQPFIELACPKLPLRSITVGPVAAPEIGELGVRALLRGTNVPELGVRRSRIPYR